MMDESEETGNYSESSYASNSVETPVNEEKAKISWLTYVLVCLFGVGSWLAINGIWNELPVLVNHAPEKWSLPSYLTVITELANIGPLIYSVGNKFSPKIVHERTAVYTIITIGSAACVLLSFFWHRTSFILGAERSTALFTLAFFVALVDCTSTVVFLPFMAVFPEVYMSALFTGENLSSLLPSVFALIQGVDKRETITKTICQNHTCHNMTSVAFTGLNFSPDYFFVFLVIMMLTCGAAFIAINYLPAVKKHHIMEYASLQTNNRTIISSKTQDSLHQPLINEYPSNQIPASNYPDEVSLQSVAGDFRASSTQIKLCRWNGLFLYLLVLQAWINCISNGVISQVQSFACEPYGTSTYHLAVTLGGISSALICLAYIWISTKSPNMITFCCFIYTLLSCYIIALASQSPNPILKDSTVGDLLVIFASILSGIFVNYAKLSICMVMREKGHRELFWCGVAIQVGSFIGAIIMFPLVNVAKVFKQ